MASGSGEFDDRGALRIYRDRTNGTLIWWYGAPDGADIEDPDVWCAANPASWLQDGKELAKEYARLRARGATHQVAHLSPRPACPIARSVDAARRLGRLFR